MMSVAQLTMVWAKEGSNGAYAPVGYVTGGSHGVKDEPEALHSAGGDQGVVYNDCSAEPTFTCDLVNAGLWLLGKVQRTVYPKGFPAQDLYFKVGNDIEAYEIGPCTIDRAKLAWAYSPTAKVSLQVWAVGLYASQITSDLTVPVIDKATNLPFTAANLTAVLGTGSNTPSAQGLTNWDVEWNNGIKALGDADSRVTGKKRWPTKWDIDLEKVTATLITRNYLPYADVGADSPSGRILTFAIAADNGTGAAYKGFTITGTAVHVLAPNQNQVRREENGHVPQEHRLLALPGEIVVAPTAV
jgi:hypothetical protein